MADGLRIVFLGPPNSGKGTQALMLASRLGVPAISTGEMLRAAVAAGSDLGLRVGDVMARGELVNDDLMAEVVSARLAQDDAARGFILDGYPRTLPQAETLKGILDRLEAALDAVILIDAPTDVLIARGLGRGRVDDSVEVMRDRLRVYREKTEPLITYYDRLGVLHSVDGDQSIEQVGQQLLAVVGVGT